MKVYMVSGDKDATCLYTVCHIFEHNYSNLGIHCSVVPFTHSWTHSVHTCDSPKLELVPRFSAVSSGLSER